MSSSAVYLTPDQLQRDLSLRDLSDPTAGPHAVQLLTGRAVEALASAWPSEVRWCPGPKVVPVTDNYDRLGYAPGAVTREARYTRYVDPGHMLRSHSTAMVPPALRQLATEPTADDVLLVCPGMVYRRDAIDWQHTGCPHQLDIWRITRRPMNEADLDEMIATLLEALVPGLPHRVEARVHPYTTGGRQIDVLRDDHWVEVWECGIAHPGVLAAAGLGNPVDVTLQVSRPGRCDVDRVDVSGLALGMGLDRLLMLVKGIPDIRLLRSADPRVASQMLDLTPYQPVSAMPAITRDLSVAVSADDDEETLGDRVRNALGAQAPCVEEVRVLSSTPCEQLPAPAAARLGATPGQQNLLVRVVLRDLEKTLTSEEANSLRDQIYRALHQGTQYQWAHPDAG